MNKNVLVTVIVVEVDIIAKAPISSTEYKHFNNRDNKTPSFSKHLIWNSYLT